MGLDKTKNRRSGYIDRDAPPAAGTTSYAGYTSSLHECEPAERAADRGKTGWVTSDRQRLADCEGETEYKKEREKIGRRERSAQASRRPTGGRIVGRTLPPTIFPPKRKRESSEDASLEEPCKQPRTIVKNHGKHETDSIMVGEQDLEDTEEAIDDQDKYQVSGQTTRVRLTQLGVDYDGALGTGFQGDCTQYFLKPHEVQLPRFLNDDSIFCAGLVYEDADNDPALDPNAAVKDAHYGPHPTGLRCVKDRRWIVVDLYYAGRHWAVPVYTGHGTESQNIKNVDKKAERIALCNPKAKEEFKKLFKKRPLEMAEIYPGYEPMHPSSHADLAGLTHKRELSSMLPIGRLKLSELHRLRNEIGNLPKRKDTESEDAFKRARKYAAKVQPRHFPRAKSVQMSGTSTRSKVASANHASVLNHNMKSTSMVKVGQLNNDVQQGVTVSMMDASSVRAPPRSVKSYHDDIY
ncbi:hypothetical protein BDV96DRAFT_644634 [Lophiotrema nucula]|uniref:Uncharacterized protein n=1 Tax=Lophiotrema nucula TaxID=690887 RepID=A0A6A5ZFK6_9PLEO|nr:hypothetical protein BDV96DRAFT_644634 [Lophiotrema nucula]